MDPNACLERIAALLLRVESGEVSAGMDLDFACQDLYDWLSRGGYEPYWEHYPTIAASYYFCRAIHHRRGERVA